MGVEEEEEEIYVEGAKESNFILQINSFKLRTVIGGCCYSIVCLLSSTESRNGFTSLKGNRFVGADCECELSSTTLKIPMSLSDVANVAFINVLFCTGGGGGGRKEGKFTEFAYA